MEWNTVLTWAIEGIVGGSVVYGVRILSQMRDSIDTLNRSVSGIIEKTLWHEKELDRHDARLTRLEVK